MSDDLQNVISEAMLELNPSENLDNQVEDTFEDDAKELTPEIEDLLGNETDVELEDEDETVEDEVVEEEDDSDDSDSDSGEKYTVKVDGEKFEVTLDELKSGYQRQADYTREKQALKAEQEEIEEVREQYATQFEALSELDAAWEENPSMVLAHFASNTENPTQAVAMLIRDLAADNKLDRQFLDMFGITSDIQNQWKQETDLERLQRENQKGALNKEQQFEETQMELEVQKAIQQYERQIDEIIDTEGLDLSVKQRNAFRQELASYAASNDLTNLKAAYKAFKYEESQKKSQLAAKTVERAKAKKATNVVSRSSSAEGLPVQDTSNLTSLIKQAMKEAGN